MDETSTEPLNRITNNLVETKNLSANISFYIFDENLILENYHGIYFLDTTINFESKLGLPITEIDPQFAIQWAPSLTIAKKERKQLEARILFNQRKFISQIVPTNINSQNYYILNLIPIEEYITSSIDLELEEKNVVHYEESLHREIISIFDWRNEIEGKTISREWMETALPNLNTSLMQGSGLGALVTSIGTIIRKAKREGDQVTIPSMIFDMLEENFQSTKKLVQTLAEAQKIFEAKEHVTEDIAIHEVHTLLMEEVKELHDMLQIKSQQIQISTIKNGNTLKIKIHKLNFKRVIRETLINAMKYGNNNCTIFILLLHARDHFIVKVLNPPADTSIHSLDFTKSHETVFFQPFYRHNKYVDERYTKEEFGLGLGLPVIKKFIEAMEAKVYFNLLKSNLYSNFDTEVSVSLEFPFCTNFASQ